MKLNAEQINKIKEIAEEYDFDYAAIGFRSQDVPFELGAIDHVSCSTTTFSLQTSIKLRSVSSTRWQYSSLSVGFGIHITN